MGSEAAYALRARQTSLIDVTMYYLVVLLPLLLASSGLAAPAAAPRRLVGGVVPPLHTAGRNFVDATGARVRLRCASWSGAQEKWFVPSGLWAQPRRVIARMARQGGLNCIRLVWSLEAVLRAANGTAVVPAAAVAANRDLAGQSPLQVRASRR
jgi:hypothetical protein